MSTDTIDINSINVAEIRLDGLSGCWGRFVGPKAYEAAAFVHDQMKKWVDAVGAAKSSKDVKVPTKYDLLVGLIATAKLVFGVQCGVHTKPIPRKKYKTK